MKILPLNQRIWNILRDTTLSEKQKVHLIYQNAVFDSAEFKLEEVVNMVDKENTYAHKDPKQGITLPNHKYQPAQEALLFEGWEFLTKGTGIYKEIASGQHYIKWFVDHILIGGNHEIKCPKFKTRGQFIEQCNFAGIELEATPKAIKELT